MSRGWIFVVHVCICYDESYFCSPKGELVSRGGGVGDGDLDGVMEGEEGGGWEVGDDDLELPLDLVSELKSDITLFQVMRCLSIVSHSVVHICV